MTDSKAPGSDGFHAGFYQRTWDSVGGSVTKFALNFFETGKLPEECNDILISLIPKVPCPEMVKQLRPIGLCNVTYKIITKVMTTRLKKVMQKLVGPYQSSFIAGRQISDNILVYQEALHSMRSKGGK